MTDRLGFSGRVARQFLQTEITPLLALLGLLLGLFAIAVTPREEEPQIDVTFANVFIPFPGASARQVEQLVTSSAEQVLSEIEGVKHIYSNSRPGLAVLTVEFEVGEHRTECAIQVSFFHRLFYGLFNRGSGFFNSRLFLKIKCIERNIFSGLFLRRFSFSIL